MLKKCVFFVAAVLFKGLAPPFFCLGSFFPLRSFGAPCGLGLGFQAVGWGLQQPS